MTCAQPTSATPLAASPSEPWGEPESSEAKPALVTELLLLPSGELFIHNLTPTFAELLAQLGFHGAQQRLRELGSPARTALPSNDSRLEP